MEVPLGEAEGVDVARWNLFKPRQTWLRSWSWSESCSIARDTARLFHCRVSPSREYLLQISRSLVNPRKRRAQPRLASWVLGLRTWSRAILLVRSAGLLSVRGTQAPRLGLADLEGARGGLRWGVLYCWRHWGPDPFWVRSDSVAPADSGTSHDPTIRSSDAQKDLFSVRHSLYSGSELE